MKRFSLSVLTAITGFLSIQTALIAQQPSYVPGVPPKVAPAVALPQTVPPQVFSGATSVPVQSVVLAGACCQPTCKVCVRETKPMTKKVYACKCEEYCLPHCSFFSLFQGKCDCADGNCGDLKVRHRLVVKKVPAPDTFRCVPKEVPVKCDATIIPATPILDPLGIPGKR